MVGIRFHKGKGFFLGIVSSCLISISSFAQFDQLSSQLMALATIKKSQQTTENTGVSGLEAAARKIETVLTKNAEGIIDSSLIDSFKGSKGSDNRYKISSHEPTVMRNAKAMINLLRSLDSIPPQLVDSIISGSSQLKTAFLNSESDLQLYVSTGKAAAKTGANVVGGTLARAAGDAVGSFVSSPVASTKKIGAFLWNNMGAVLNPKQVLADAASGFAEMQTAPFRAAIQDFEIYAQEAKHLTQTVQALSESSSPAIQKLKQLSSVLTDNDIFQTYEQFNKGLLKTSVEGTAQARGFSAKARPTAGEQRPASLLAFEEINALVTKRLSQENLSPNEKYHLKKVQKIGSEMQTVATNALTKTSSASDLLSYIKKVGAVWNELQTLDAHTVSGNLLGKGMNQIYSSLAGPMKELVTLTLETEISLGMDKGILLPKLEKLSNQMNSFAGENGLQKVSGYPFTEERKTALARHVVKMEEKQARIEAARKYIRENPISAGGPTLMQTLKLIEQLEEIPSVSSGKYIQKLIEYKDEITGLKQIRDSIGALESEIFILDEKIKKTDLSQLDGQEMIFHENDKKRLAAAFDEVGDAYQKRDRLQGALQKAEDWKNDYAVRGGKSREFVMGKSVTSASYFQADGFVHIKETVNPGQIEAVNALANAVLKDVDLLGDDLTKEKERLSKQVTSLGGDPDDYFAAERTRRANQKAKAEENKPSTKSASSLTNKEMDKIEKKALAKEEEAFRRNLDRSIESDVQIDKAKEKKARNQAILVGIRENAGEGIKTQIQETRKAFVESVKGMLTPEQSALLGDDKRQNRLFSASSEDTVLVRNVKNVSNIMTRAENISELAVKFRAISSGGYGQLELATLAAPLRDEINALVSDFKTARKDLKTLSSVLGHSYAQIADGLESAMPVVDHIPKMFTKLSDELAGFSDIVDVEQLKKLAQSVKIDIEKALPSSNAVVDDAMGAKSSKAPTKTASSLDAKYILKSFAGKLSKSATDAAYGHLEAAGLKPGKNGLYKLNKLDPESLEYGLALLHNTAHRAKELLDATGEVSEGKALGNAKLLSSALGALKDAVENYNKVVNVTLPKFSGASEDLTQRLNASYKAIQSEAGALFEKVQPAVKKIIADAQVTEQTLGIKKGFVTKPIVSGLQALEQAADQPGTLVPAKTEENKQQKRSQKLEASKSQLNMLKTLKGSPEQNNETIDAQIKQTQKVVKKLDNKIKLTVAGKKETIPRFTRTTSPGAPEATPVTATSVGQNGAGRPGAATTQSQRTAVTQPHADTPLLPSSLSRRPSSARLSQARTDSPGAQPAPSQGASLKAKLSQKPVTPREVQAPSTPASPSARRASVTVRPGTSVAPQPTLLPTVKPRTTTAVVSTRPSSINLRPRTSPASSAPKPAAARKPFFRPPPKP